MRASGSAQRDRRPPAAPARAGHARRRSCERDLRVPMDDGVVLLADRWAPRRRGRRAADRARALAVRPQPARSASCSGACSPSAGSRSSSRASAERSAPAGDFDPFDERADGLATLRWLREQPWHAGPSGRSGRATSGSCSGRSPTRLRRAGTVGHRVAVPRHGARRRQHLARHGAVVAAPPRGAGAAPRARCCWRRPAPHAAAAVADARAARRPRRARVRRAGSPLLPRVDRADGARQPVLGGARLLAAVGDVKAPVQLVGGWYDIFLPWMVEDFRALRARRPPAAADHRARGRTRRRP